MADRSAALRDRRETVVRTHMASENRHEFDVTLATFRHPRYELIGTGQVFDGEEAVRQYYAASRTAFPDQRNEIHALRHADDAVLVDAIVCERVYFDAATILRQLGVGAAS
ncbi:MAG TPA: nuclear transport factor 2 family protein [Candidatus Binatia bacterium]|jgi:hypothetical protein|nr:nuclear transport factor 2 family protein [Candidatus Binatia bacterium]